MEKAATFHSPETPPDNPSTSSSNQNETRKKRSHTVTLPRLPFQRHHRSQSSKNALSSPTAPPTLPLPSLPFRKHAHLHPSKTSTPSGSRRGSIALPSAPTTQPTRALTPRDRLAAYPANISLLPSSSTITPALLKRESALLSVRERDLASSLDFLNSKAHAETRRLDEVYYALLARMASLKDLVSRLRDLHATIETGRGEFTAKVQELERRSGEMVGAWQGFGDKEGEIERLVVRLGEARERGRKVEERLGGLMERVEGWEREEVTRGRKRGWWFRFGGWVGVGVVLVLVAVLAWRGVPGGFDGVDDWGSGWEGRHRDVGIRIGVDEGWEREEEERGKRWKGVLDEL
ncbi:Hypothetical protein D9617_6g092540 [Elsinoe fawcettii]|nr:Hypothetical protein D9617_6g092540 [Elsinoe fawcettii]